MEISYNNDKKHEDTIINNIFPTHTANVMLCGLTYPDKEFFWKDNLTHYYIFDYIVSGECTYTVNKKEYHAGAGDLVLISKNSYVSLWSKSYLRYYMSIYGPLVDNLCGFFEIETPIHIKKADALEDFSNLFNKMKANDVSEELYLKSIYSVILKATDKACFYNNAQELTVADKAYSYIQNNFADIDTIDDICKAIHASKSNLIHQYTKKFGVSPYHTIMSNRLNLAKSLLAYTSLTIKEISNAANFNDVSNFMRQFKKECGCTPTEYRNQRQ